MMPVQPSSVRASGVRASGVRARRRGLLAAALVAALPAPALAVLTRSPRMIVGFPPGGGVDILARILSPPMSETLGQTIVVENRGGAGGNLASEATVRAAPDGHTVMLGNIAQLAINPALYQRLAFDPQRDLAPIARTTFLRFAAFLHPDVPARTLDEFVALARARPGQFSYSSPGSGSVAHLVTEQFRRAAGIELIHVPYRGSGPAVLDLIAGRIHFAIDGEPVMGPHVQAGRLRALATLSPTRSAMLPDAPTAAQAGFPDLLAMGWQGLVGPLGVSPAAIEAWSAAAREALARPAVRQALAAVSIEPAFEDAAAFRAFIAAEADRWGGIARLTGASVE